jgi:hypothetical protein
MNCVAAAMRGAKRFEDQDFSPQCRIALSGRIGKPQP